MTRVDERLFTVNKEIVRRLTNDRLRVDRQVLFALDLVPTAIYSGGASPDVDVVLSALKFGDCQFALF